MRNGNILIRYTISIKAWTPSRSPNAHTRFIRDDATELTFRTTANQLDHAIDNLLQKTAGIEVSRSSTGSITILFDRRLMSHTEAVNHVESVLDPVLLYP